MNNIFPPQTGSFANIRTIKCKIFTSPKHSIGSEKANKSGEQEKKE